MIDQTPLVVFVYDRPKHTIKLFNSLSNSDEIKNIDLYIYSDAAKNDSNLRNVENVRDFINNLQGYKSITIKEANVNQGLAKSVIKGVSEVLEIHKKVIVLEDDLIVSPNLITYMNQNLEEYKMNQEIWSISGYTPDLNLKIHNETDVYKAQRGCSWGWATWQDRWDLVDWDINYYEEIKKNSAWIKGFNCGGNDLFFMLQDQVTNRIDSWAIRWVASQYINQKYTIYPSESLISNSGNDNSGTHSSKTNKFNIKLNCTKNSWNLPYNIENNIEIEKAFKSFYDLNLKGYLGVYLRKLGLYNIIKKILN